MKLNYLFFCGKRDSYREYQFNNSNSRLLETKKIVESYLKSRKHMDRELILQIVDRIEVHEDKTIDLHLKLKPLEQLI